MIIEFIGLPSAGKTTIIRQWQQQYEGKFKITNPLDNLYKKPWAIRNIYKIIFLTKNIFLNVENVSILYRVYKDNKGIRKKEAFKRLFNNIFYVIFYNSFKQNDNEIFVFDEGILHHCWATFLNNNTDKVIDFSKSITFNKKTNFLIYIKMDEKLAFDRNFNRSYKNDRKIKVNQRHLDLFNNFSREIEKMNLLVDNFKHDYPEKLITFDANSNEKIDLEVLVKNDRNDNSVFYKE